MILQKQSGQSLIEILVAIGVGVIMLVGAVTALTPAIKSLSDVSKTQGAAAISKELLDNLRIFVEANWHNIDTLSTSTKYFLNTATSTFAVATGTETVISDGITSGLVGYWKFDDNEGASVMDFSGNGNAGLKSGNIVAASSCWAGGCYSFDGLTGNISIPHSLVLNPSQYISVSAWINPADITTNTYYEIYRKDDNTNRHLLSFQENGTILSFGIGTAGNGYQELDVAISPADYVGGWHLITAVYDGQKKYIYRDGVEIGSQIATGEITSVNSSLSYIGAYLGTSEFFSGKIDDVRIYDRALNAAEINTIYRANLFTRNFQVADVYRDGNDEDKIIEGTSGALDPSTKKVTIEYGWSGAQLKTFSAYFTRYKNRSFVQYGWQGGVGTAYTTTTANWFTTSSNINYSTSTGLRIFGL